MKFERITFDPKIMGGQACLRGTRVPVSAILSQVAAGMTPKEILEGFPDLQARDIQQSIEYAAWLSKDAVLSF